MSTEDSNRSAVGRKLPIWILGPQDDKEARLNLKKFAYKECDQYIKAMAECSKEHGIKLFPACTPHKEKMAECLLFYQTDPKYLDEERDKIVQRKFDMLEKQIKERKHNEANR